MVVVRVGEDDGDDLPAEVLDVLADATRALGGVGRVDDDCPLRPQDDGRGHVDRAVPEANRPVSNAEIAAFDTLKSEGAVRTTLNTTFLTMADSTSPELAGIWGAAKGSLLTLLVTLLICFPIGVMTAIYLEEYAPKNRITDIIEVSINNLAAVPSIIFGLLGLAVFLNFFGMPRSAPDPLPAPARRRPRPAATRPTSWSGPPARPPAPSIVTFATRRPMSMAWLTFQS